MRLLIVTYGELRPELGAPQMAIHLAGALAARGHEVVSWASGKGASRVRWWQAWREPLPRLEAFLRTSGPFDAIDLPAIAATSRLARIAPLIVRTVQPDLSYFAVTVARELWPLPRNPVRSAAHLAYWLRHSAAVLGGFQRARVIACLGSQERDWLARYLPWMRRKVFSYLDAPSPSDQRIFAAIRAERRPPTEGALRFLWIGRWVAHKGTDRLVRWLTQRATARPADQFTLAGCGSDAARDLPASLLASGRLRIIPSFTRQELPEILRQHEAGLFTSHVEGWGLSLNEMLEAGLTVFATEAGGVRNLRPYFPATLLPFPPPAEPRLAEARTLDLTEYYRSLTWPAIAEMYEKEVFRRLLDPSGSHG